MKFLILLFLLSFNAFAEWKVDATNYEGQKRTKGGFATKIDAQKYVDRVKSKWGKERRWSQAFCEDNLGFRIVEDEVEGNYTEYDCPQTYSVEIKDISNEIKEKKEKEEKRSKDIKDIKKLAATIEADETLKPYMKKLLKRVILEMKE